MAKLLSPQEVVAAQKSRLGDAANDILNAFIGKRFSLDERTVRISIEELREAFEKASQPLPEIEHIMQAFSANGWRAEYKSPARMGEDPFCGLELTIRI